MPCWKIGRRARQASRTTTLCAPRRVRASCKLRPPPPRPQPPRIPAAAAPPRGVGTPAPASAPGNGACAPVRGWRPRRHLVRNSHPAGSTLSKGHRGARRAAAGCGRVAKARPSLPTPPRQLHWDCAAQRAARVPQMHHQKPRAQVRAWEGCGVCGLLTAPAALPRHRGPVLSATQHTPCTTARKPTASHSPRPTHTHRTDLVCGSPRAQNVTFHPPPTPPPPTRPPLPAPPAPVHLRRGDWGLLLSRTPTTEVSRSISLQPARPAPPKPVRAECCRPVSHMLPGILPLRVFPRHAGGTPLARVRRRTCAPPRPSTLQNLRAPAATTHIVHI